MSDKSLKATLDLILKKIVNLEEKNEFNGNQITEMYNMVTNMSVKLDVMDQKKTDEQTDTVKKSTKRKPNTKANKEKTDTEKTTDELNTEEIDDDAKSNTSTQSQPKKRAPAKKRTPVKKTDEPKEEDTVEMDNNTEPTEDDVEEKKPVKKVKPTTNKKTPVKKQYPNKLEYFNLMFDTDENYFDTYLTADVKKTIEKENHAVWEKMDNKALHMDKRKKYYNYMNENHTETLQSMKKEHNANLDKQKMKLLNKEETD